MLSDCRTQKGSWYFDRTIQQVYIHMEHGYSPFTSPVDYGYALGLCSSSLGVVYIEDCEYLPLITQSIDIESESDVVGSSRPTGTTGTIICDNHAIPDPVTGIPRGELDFLLTETIYGNDVFLYDYVNGILNPIRCFYIENFDHSLKEVTLNVQDKRFS